jgi:hypothetical protein
VYNKEHELCISRTTCENRAFSGHGGETEVANVSSNIPDSNPYSPTGRALAQIPVPVGDYIKNLAFWYSIMYDT